MHRTKTATMGGAPIVSLRTLLLLHGGSCLLGCVPKMTLNPEPTDRNAHTHTRTHTHTHTHTTGMYFLDKCDQLQRPPRFTTPLQLQAAQLCSLLPFAVALWVAISRTVDYWHHYSDVIAGSLLGFAIAHIRCRWRERDTHRMHARTGSKTQRNGIYLSFLAVCLSVCDRICARVRLWVCARALKEAEQAPEHQRARFKPITLNPKS